MAGDPNAVEQAVTRTLRDSLVRIQRTSEELNQAISDLVSACASSRATNALPPMVRAQSAAASLSAAFEVLARFVTSSLQPNSRSPFEDEMLRHAAAAAPQLPPALAPAEPEPPKQMAEDLWTPPPMEPAPPLELPRFELPAEPAETKRGEAVPVFVREASSSTPPPLPQQSSPPQVAAIPEPMITLEPEPVAAFEPEPPIEIALPEPDPVFSLGSLPADEQELHRRAYRVAKVSMQDIKLLRPEDVRVGRENRDLCIRLRDDIEKAHKEYDRRFQAIQSHPVDYFYDWMVEILGGGNPEALGEYPYPSAVMHH